MKKGVYKGLRWQVAGKRWGQSPNASTACLSSSQVSLSLIFSLLLSFYLLFPPRVRVWISYFLGCFVQELTLNGGFVFESDV